MHERSGEQAKPSEVAAYLQVSEATLKDWRYRQVGPSFTHAGRLVRYDWSDVHQWLKARRRTAAKAG